MTGVSPLHAFLQVGCALIFLYATAMSFYRVKLTSSIVIDFIAYLILPLLTLLLYNILG